MDLERARAAGREAFAAGFPIAACPYSSGMLEGRAWRTAYLHAQLEAVHGEAQGAAVEKRPAAAAS